MSARFLTAESLAATCRTLGRTLCRTIGCSGQAIAALGGVIGVAIVVFSDPAFVWAAILVAGAVGPVLWTRKSLRAAPPGAAADDIDRDNEPYLTLPPA